MTIMVTGGAGYIGSHTCVELISKGYSIVIYDNFCNSQTEVINRIGRITGVSPAVVQGDVRDRDLLKNTMTKYQCSAVIHFAGLKSVGDSVAQPLEYYDNNVLGTLRLVQAMQDANVASWCFRRRRPSMANRSRFRSRRIIGCCRSIPTAAPN